MLVKKIIKMAKVDPADKWKKEVELLRLKVNDYENIIAKLQSEDSQSDSKIENLTKLHAQKIRALMQSIQELKKQNATIRAQSKENNRSKLIEKLKTELVQQEIAIQALRDIINDNDKCDEQIITYLNKGPPRIRPQSREEMKMQIRKLQSKLGISKPSKGDKAVDDLESLLNPSKSQEDEEFKVVDPMQNEKIVELVEQIQNLQLDLRAKDSTIDHLRQLNKKNQEELLKYRSNENDEKMLGFKADGMEIEKKTLLDKLSKNASSSDEILAQLESSFIELKAKNELILSLKKNIENLSSNRGAKDKEAEKYRKELNQSMKSLKDLELENKNLKEFKERILQELKNKEIEIEEIKIQQSVFGKPASEAGESVVDYKDMEIEALQAKLDEIQKKGGLPASFMAAEKAETEKYKEKTKELYLQVAELQEELEYLHQENLQGKKVGNAKALSSKIASQPPDQTEYKQKLDELIQELAKARGENKSMISELNFLRSELNAKESEAFSLQNQNKKIEEELLEMKQKIIDVEIHKKEVFQKNRENIESIMSNYSKSLPPLQVEIPREFDISKLLLFSENLVNKLVIK